MIYVFGVPYYLWLFSVLPAAFLLLAFRTRKAILRAAYALMFSLCSVLAVAGIFYANSTISVEDRLATEGTAEYLVVRFPWSLGRSKYYVETRKTYLFVAIATRQFETFDGPVFLRKEANGSIAVILYRRESGPILKRIDS
jgi:glucan phosphoethanolaminetransferase (alkaline phosphatase superfamily)